MAKRTRKHISTEGLAGVSGMDIPEVPEAIAPPGMGAKVPPRIKNGAPNPDYWRYRQALLSNFDLLIMMGQVEAPRGWDLKKSSDMLMQEAKSYGIDPRHLSDVRSEGEKMIDAAADLASNLDRLLEWSDDVLNALELGFDYCENTTLEIFRDRLTKRCKEAGKPVPDDPLGKLKAILRRVRTLRERARNPIPRTSAFERDKLLDPPAFRDEMVEATHLARHMLYVGRSTIAGKRGGAAILQLGRHHMEMIVDLWQAEKRAMFLPPAAGRAATVHVDAKRYPFEGVVEVAPPGHGKTTVATGWARLRNTLCPDSQGVWLHDKEDQAQANVEMVKHAFKEDNDVGRRHLSLFPHLRLAATGNTFGSMKLHLESPVKAPTLIAKSVWSSDLGTDNSYQIIDDVVPQKDIHEHMRRDRRVDMIATTWRTRLRGDGGFRFIVGTMWHHEDVLAKMLESARRKNNPVWLLTRIQRCERRVLHGGKERFTALWPEMYPAKKLGAIFHQMENKRLWYANYEGNPNPEESRIIQKLRYYAPTLEDHSEFLADATARGHISLDPAWTNREHSDKAGMIVGVLSKVSGVTIEGETEVSATERQIRITHARADRATASGMQDNLAAIILAAGDGGVEIDSLHIETNAAGAVIAETLENQFEVQVQRHFSGKSKEIRLRRVMGMIDDSNPTRRASILFPGKAVRDANGELVVGPDGAYIIDRDPDWEWLYRQVLDFGFTSEDHCLDALTQLANALSSEVDAGRGVVTRAVRRFMRETQDRAAMKAILQKVKRPARTGGWERDFIETNWR